MVSTNPLWWHSWIWKGELTGLVPYAPLPNNSRVTREIERTVRRGANTPRTKRKKAKVEGHKLKIQEIFDTLNAPGAPLPADSRGTATTSKSESGAPLAHLR